MLDPTTAPYTIQPSTWRDLMALRRVEEVCFLQDLWPLLDLVAVLTVPRIVRLKAVVADQMVGFVAGDPHPPDQVGWITTIGVLPEYRRRGIASDMLARCEEQMGMAFVRLCVRRSNAGAIRLYSDRGYRQVSVWAHYYLGGEDALVLEKRCEQS